MCTCTCVQYMPCFGNYNDGIMPFTKRLCAGFKKRKKKNLCQTRQISKRGNQDLWLDIRGSVKNK